MPLIPKPKIEITKNTSKIELDKYYTPISLAKRLIDKTFEVIGRENITDIIEPSAGSGSFSSQMRCTAYDIEPEAEGIIKQDFLRLELPYKKGRLCIGNPPFMSSNNGSVRFFQKAASIGDYVAYILPISQLDNNLQMYQFDLIYSEDLGLVKYSDRELHCCFNIFKRPKDGINPRPDYRLKDITIVEHRRLGKEYDKKQNKDLPLNWDYAICNFGESCFGKLPEYVGQYANELYFYVHKKEFLPQVLELLEFNRVRAYTKSISMKRMSMARFYKYLKDNIEGIE